MSPAQDRGYRRKLVQSEVLSSGSAINFVLPLLLRPLSIPEAEEKAEELGTVDAPAQPDHLGIRYKK